MRSSYLSLFFLTLVIFFASCDQNRIYEKNKKFRDRIWPKDQVVTFDFEITDIHPSYNFYFNIRNSIRYKYQNVYLAYSLEDTLGNVFQSDLTNINLFDPKTGEPLGDGLGDIFDHRVKVIGNYQFNNPGFYQFNIEHYMRPDSLEEIMAIGLRVEKSE